jgi:N-acyl-phosphatidylethanolamine-hydrolysing phospholipase D
LKNKQWFIESGVSADKITEMDWWETERTKSAAAEIEMNISCLPCQHSSGRTPFDKDKTLWASWGVKSGGSSVWFGGDTGYRSVPDLSPDEDDYDEDHVYPICPAFKQIGEHAGPFDLGLIPIGAYNPRHLLSSLHSNPYDSVNLFKDVRCKKAMAIHWGTWHMTEEPALEPSNMLKEAMVQAGLPGTGVFDVCEPGESREFKA